jgi:hypothetical protein
MSAKVCLAGLGAIACVSLSLTLAGPASADDCQMRMGPYTSQYAAELASQQARNIGYDTSGVWGEGGIISQISNRRYFFNVLFGC